MTVRCSAFGSRDRSPECSRCTECGVAQGRSQAGNSAGQFAAALEAGDQLKIAATFAAFSSQRLSDGPAIARSEGQWTEGHARQRRPRQIRCRGERPRELPGRDARCGSRCTFAMVPTATEDPGVPVQATEQNLEQQIVAAEVFSEFAKGYNLLDLRHTAIEKISGIPLLSTQAKHALIVAPAYSDVCNVDDPNSSPEVSPRATDWPRRGVFSTRLIRAIIRPSATRSSVSSAAGAPARRLR